MWVKVSLVLFYTWYSMHFLFCGPWSLIRSYVEVLLRLKSLLFGTSNTGRCVINSCMLYITSILQETNRLEYLIPKKTSLRHRLPMGDQGFIDFVAHLLEINPKKRPSASEALKHPWLSYPYEPISAWTDGGFSWWRWALL